MFNRISLGTPEQQGVELLNSTQLLLLHEKPK